MYVWKVKGCLTFSYFKCTNKSCLTIPLLNSEPYQSYPKKVGTANFSPIIIVWLKTITNRYFSCSFILHYKRQKFKMYETDIKYIFELS